MSETRAYPTGGEFLLSETDPADVFTPEDFDENQRMIAQAARDFIEQKITPRAEELEYEGNTDLGKPLLKEAGEMGLLMVDVPQRFGGMGADKATIMLISEIISWSGSFAVTTAPERDRHLPSSTSARRISSRSTCPDWPPVSC